MRLIQVRAALKARTSPSLACTDTIRAYLARRVAGLTRAVRYTSSVTQPTQPTRSPFIRACRGEPVPYTPVWFMRQAGRSLPEYHQVRAGVSMLDSCTRPELVTEITLQPLRR